MSKHSQGRRSSSRRAMSVESIESVGDEPVARIVAGVEDVAFGGGGVAGAVDGRSEDPRALLQRVGRMMAGRAASLRQGHADGWTGELFDHEGDARLRARRAFAKRDEAGGVGDGVQAGGVPIAPITEARDPRWLLACRAAEALEGGILPAQRRAGLTRLGKVLGLSPFDTNLVIAVVQDQARRGVPADQCPRAGLGQLELVKPPTQRRAVEVIRENMIGAKGFNTLLLLLNLVAVELLVLMLLFRG